MNGENLKKRRLSLSDIGDGKGEGRGRGDRERIAERAVFPMIDIHSIKNREITEYVISILMSVFDLFDADAGAVGLSKPYSQRIPIIE